MQKENGKSDIAASANSNRANENPQQKEYIDSASVSEDDGESSGSESVSASGTDSSGQSIDADWARFIEEDGSLMYVESYVSSTVKERQAHQAIKAASECERKSAFPSSANNLKKHMKLLNLLRRRPSVRVKTTAHSTGLDPGKATGSGQEQSITPKVTFRDNPSGEVRHVILRVYEMGSNYGRRASLCESVLGVMPGRFNEPADSDSRVMVAGLVPGSQALKDGFIKIGDWLKELNGIEVNWDNLDNILLDVSIPSNVTLSVQKCAVETLPHDSNHNVKRVTQTRLVKFLTGLESKTSNWESMLGKGAVPLHAVLLLSLKGVTEQSPDGADIRYQFPSVSNKLIQVRGMFLTLAHSLQEVVGSPVLSCTVTLHGVHYHAAFYKEQDDVFMIILPHFCMAEPDLVYFMEQVKKLIKFQFGALSSALSEPSNKECLDRLFLLMFEDILTLEEGYGGGSVPQMGSGTPGVTPQVTDYATAKSKLMFGTPSLLVLRDEFSKIQLEICLNELESGDFGDNESDCEACLLLYNIIGCCIFYKDQLVLSHLDPESTQLVFLYADRYHLLHLLEREAISQLVIWRRVYPPAAPPQEGGHYPSLQDREIHHYVLFVAMNHFLLATLVESGNVTQLMDRDAGPDPFLVDQAETTLYHLHSLHVHTACEESLISSAFETVCLDTKKTASLCGKGSKSEKTTQNAPGAALKEEGAAVRVPDVPSILKQKSPSSPEPHWGDSAPFEFDRGSSLPEEGSDDSFNAHSFPDGGGEEETPSREDSFDSDWRIWKGSDAKMSPSLPDAGTMPPKCFTPFPQRVTVGSESLLLHLVELDCGESVVVVSSSYGEDSPPSLHTQLIRNFYSAVSHIRHVLHAARRSKVSSGTYSGLNSLNSAKEYGIMFGCQVPHKGKTQDVNYWVVGRCYGSPFERELYVALEDTVPQNMQEIAFRVALGRS